MKIIDHSFQTPQENLACDEALLDESEASDGPEVLRFWTSPNPFVVLGYSNAWKDEVKDRHALPVLRRCSGGGTVLQGPGCLNYTLILKTTPEGPLSNIRSTNVYVMERQRAALEKALGKEVRVQGHTDLTVGDLKFSGNAQRRKKNRLLFHGTFLIDFDLSQIARFLKVPGKQPAYRKGRPHKEFVTNLGVSASRVKETVAKAWHAEDGLERWPEKRMAQLVAERYSRKDWNFKF